MSGWKWYVLSVSIFILLIVLLALISNWGLSFVGTE
jgi:hypothetical protein